MRATQRLLLKHNTNTMAIAVTVGAGQLFRPTRPLLKHHGWFGASGGSSADNASASSSSSSSKVGMFEKVEQLMDNAHFALNEHRKCNDEGFFGNAKGSGCGNDPAMEQGALTKCLGAIKECDHLLHNWRGTNNDSSGSSGGGDGSFPHPRGHGVLDELKSKRESLWENMKPFMKDKDK